MTKTTYRPVKAQKNFWHAIGIGGGLRNTETATLVCSWPVKFEGRRGGLNVGASFAAEKSTSPG